MDMAEDTCETCRDDNATIKKDTEHRRTEFYASAFIAETDRGKAVTLQWIV